MTKTKRMIATYAGEEITATFEQTFTLDDYGVPGSPVFWSPCYDAEIMRLEICGVDVPFVMMPGSVIDAIIELADDLEWTDG